MNVRIINLKCNNCAGTLEILPDTERFACGYCGSEQMVIRQGGTVSLRIVTEAIRQVQVAADKTAAELALKRIEAEIAEARRELKSLRSQENTASASLNILSVVITVAVFFTGTGIAIAAAVYLNNDSEWILGGVTLSGLLISIVISYTVLKYANAYINRSVNTETRPKIKVVTEQIENLKSQQAMNRKIVDS